MLNFSADNLIQNPGFQTGRLCVRRCGPWWRHEPGCERGGAGVPADTGVRKDLLSPPPQIMNREVREVKWPESQSQDVVDMECEPDPGRLET